MLQQCHFTSGVARFFSVGGQRGAGSFGGGATTKLRIEFPCVVKTCTIKCTSEFVSLLCLESASLALRFDLFTQINKQASVYTPFIYLCAVRSERIWVIDAAFTHECQNSFLNAWMLTPACSNHVRDNKVRLLEYTLTSLPRGR